MKTKSNIQFSYKGQLFTTAKECYDYFKVPDRKRYNYEYYKALKDGEDVVVLDKSIDYSPQLRETYSFEHYVEQIRKWYQAHDTDPCITSSDKQERQLACKIQNFRKAYKNYLYEQLGEERKTNHYINKKQIQALNDIGFEWNKKHQKRKRLS